jgi:hypothetical protein
MSAVDMELLAMHGLAVKKAAEVLRLLGPVPPAAPSAAERLRAPVRCSPT